MPHHNGPRGVDGRAAGWMAESRALVQGLDGAVDGVPGLRLDFVLVRPGKTPQRNDTERHDKRDTYFLLSPQICFADGGPGNRVDRGAAKCCQRHIDESHPCWFRKSGWGSLMSVAIVFVV